MRMSRIILLLVALLAGGLAAFLATRGDAPQPTVVEGPTQVVQEARAQVLVAKTAIGVGQRLNEDTIEWQDWPEMAVRPEYVNKTVMPDALTQMSGSVARFEFFPGEPILAQKLVKTDQGYMSAVLPAGMRGVSVQVNADAAAGGFIFPNDRVDVVLTRNSSSGSMVSETILSNVKVLAIGKRLGETGTTGAPTDPQDPGADVFQSPTIATFELDPQEGETIINAAKIGTLSLVLRSIADYAASSEPVEAGRNSNRAIKLIRFGKGTDVMSTRPMAGETEEQSATVAPAAFPAAQQPQ
jgi:pilus assembly protein CpaB